MNEVKNSIVSSTVNYLNKLQYLAVDDKKTASDIMLLIITDEVYDWGNWLNVPQSEQLQIQKFRKLIIRDNPELVEVVTKTNEFYKNVSLPQTLYTWQRVYDNSEVQTIEEITQIPD